MLVPELPFFRGFYSLFSVKIFKVDVEDSVGFQFRFLKSSVADITSSQDAWPYVLECLQWV